MRIRSLRFKKRRVSELIRLAGLILFCVGIGMLIVMMIPALSWILALLFIAFGIWTFVYFS